MAFSFASICYGKSLQDDSDEKVKHFENNFESLNNLIMAISEPCEEEKATSANTIDGSDITNNNIIRFLDESVDSEQTEAFVDVEIEEGESIINEKKLRG